MVYFGKGSVIYYIPQPDQESNCVAQELWPKYALLTRPARGAGGGLVLVLCSLPSRVEERQ